MTLLRGNRVAWQSVGASGWSAAHRVFEGGFTYCSRQIPPDAVIAEGKRAAKLCSRCESLCARAQKYREQLGKAHTGFVGNR